MRLRIVLDTNVYISRMLREQSIAGRAVAKAWREAVTLVSPETLEELHEVLWRPKFAPYIRPETIEPYLDLVRSLAEQISEPQPIRACRDPRDDKFLALAVSGRADAIVSGDADLAAMSPFRGIEILGPGEYLERE